LRRTITKVKVGFPVGRSAKANWLTCHAIQGLVPLACQGLASASP